MVYSTLAGDQYDKVIVPRNEGATTKTNLTGECRRNSGLTSLNFCCKTFIYYLLLSSAGLSCLIFCFCYAVSLITVHLMCTEDVGK